MDNQSNIGYYKEIRNFLSKTERAYFKAAEAISELSNYPVHKLGAVVVSKHHIVGSGCNSRTKCHPLQAKLDTEKYGVECPGYVHAEIAALLPLIRDKINLNGAAIYIFRKHQDGTLAMAKPCSNCQKIIKQLGIKKICYTVEGSYKVEKWR